ncbi:hypothetical protein [Janthinobacterium sp. GB4P2]|uniref:hypothetical protein n=1 Tax=Janthinobacterium sp. GB4P2 TaxID=3424189 RepID=UPI003F52843C
MLGSATRAGHRLRCREPAIVARPGLEAGIFHTSCMAASGGKPIHVHLIWHKVIAIFRLPDAILTPNGYPAWNLARHLASISLLVSAHVASGTPGVSRTRFSLR